ncbi:MAG: peptidylprolyl isomerase [Candidatus Marinimicrobia bacterium]|nr:peptidylprolyl isomerase [Candidatus Neomarinimicrobiota bacterium]
MATLTTIREKQHIILWAFLFIFILSLSIGGLVGGANIIDQLFGSNLTGNAVGAVNTDRITIEELSQAIALQTQQAREQFGELNDRLVDQAESEAWENVITRHVLLPEMSNRRLEVTGDEIYYILQNYPPLFVQQSEAFQRDGQFDPNLYFQALNNPAGNEWAPVEAFLANVLPGEKMNAIIRALTYTSEEEVKSAWYDRNTQATIDYIYVPTSKINTDEIVVSDRDIERAYTRDKETYALPAMRIIDYVVWEKLPTPEDSADVFRAARELIERVSAGEDFAQLALEYSDDAGSGTDGGNLGWFGKGQMVGPFEKAAFAAEAGELVGPVRTQFGYHVIKVVERREGENGPEIKASHILLNVSISPRSVSQMRTQANIFSFDAADSSFEAALIIQGLANRTSPALRIGDKFLPPPVGMSRAAVRFAFEAEVGAISNVIENDQSYLVARLAEARPQGFQPLEDVRGRIERALKQEAAQIQVELIMANLREQLARTDDWSAAAATFPEASYATGVSGPLTGSFSGIGRSARLAGVLKTMAPDQVSGVITLERGQAIIRLVTFEEPDSEKFQAVRDAEHRRLFDRRLSTAWTQWIDDLKAQAKIIDNRHRFF